MDQSGHCCRQQLNYHFNNFLTAVIGIGYTTITNVMVCLLNSKPFEEFPEEVCRFCAYLAKVRITAQRLCKVQKMPRMKTKKVSNNSLIYILCKPYI